MKKVFNDAVVTVNTVRFGESYTVWAVYTDTDIIRGSIPGEHIHLATAFALNALRNSK